jgi:heterodisulfide reductase subunit A
MRKKKVVVIGGGIAGMESAAYLTAMGYNVTLLEKTDKLGGHLLNWGTLFPTMRSGKEVIDFLNKGIHNENVRVLFNTEVTGFENNNGNFLLKLNDDSQLSADALLVTTGADLFDTKKKEEYGYGIYDNVITSAELEKMFSEGGSILTAEGKVPKRVGFVHCVGSRDEKVGNKYCSKVCCVTAVKQSIELKEMLPDTEVFCFYMDLRMYGMHFEKLYKEAQEKHGIGFIRGRLSEACENIDKSIMLKVEDTLAGKPLKMNVDLLVLMIGFVTSKGTKGMSDILGLKLGENGFFKTMDQHTLTNISNVPGIFFAGTCTSPKAITNTITDARAAVTTVASYLEGFDIEKGRRK